MAVSLLAVHEASNRGYAYVELFRWMWHCLHWWTIPAGTAVVALCEGVAVLFRRGEG